MPISSQTRRAGPFTGNGTATVFSFEFKIFDKQNLRVVVSDGETEADLSSDDYTVTLNDNQDESPGGYVTLNAALAEGSVLALVSNVPYTQNLLLTNRGGFFPETINKAMDWLECQIQQLLDLSDRAIRLADTDTMTAAELKASLLEVAAKAADYAKDAKTTLETAQKLLETIKSTVTTEGDTQVKRVTTEGDTQVKRLGDITEETLVGYGVGCQERVWTVTEASEEGTEITIPSGMNYVVGRHHLRMAWNGLVLKKTQNFEEVGTQDEKSTVFKINFPLEVGDELMAWTVPLGRGDLTDTVSELTTQINTTKSALADLSAKVVYKSEEAATDTTTTE